MNKAFTLRVPGHKWAVVVTAGLLICSVATAHPDDGPCSTRTLKGDYGFKIDGQLLAGPVRGILRGLAMTNFDGRGGVSQIDFTTINGVPRSSAWRSATGTYTLNDDCTGAMELVPSDGSPILKLRLIVVGGGKEIHTVVEGNPTGSVGYRRE